MSFIFITGCAVSPNHFSAQETVELTASDRLEIKSNSQPIGATLTLEEAVARALKYNLDQRVKMLEQSLAAGELEAGKFDMLPKLLVNAGYDWRSNFSHRYDAPYVTPTIFDTSSKPDVSVDPEHAQFDLKLSWNILDFGASYYSAKQNADKLLIANEKRRKAMHLLIQKVRTAYWRALAAESLSEQVKITTSNAEKALTESEILAAERLSKPEEALRYQRNLLENLRLLESVEQELISARIELMNLIGAPPTARTKLIRPDLNMGPLKLSSQEMEEMALASNADLKAQMLNARVAAQETRKALLKLLPGISLNFGKHYDDDRYLVNDDWSSAGLTVSYNLLNLLSGPSLMDMAEKREALEKARRMALQMTVLTQVHLSRNQYANAMKQYLRAKKIYKVDAQLEQIVKGKFAGKMVSKQTQISANVTTILSELRLYQAMSKLQEASGQIQSTLGQEPYIDSVDDIVLKDLAADISKWFVSNSTTKGLAE
ncbi:TolC family protein [Neptuniibacter sp. QD37_6]|uniref:TolC family protein n=1 Tax=Neptuniibacter sp. QD37_6 TaxID=3398210 RepID=UPI0039F4781A